MSILVSFKISVVGITFSSYGHLFWLPIMQSSHWPWVSSFSTISKPSTSFSAPFMHVTPKCAKRQCQVASVEGLRSEWTVRVVG